MTWNKRLYFPSEGRCAENYFALKNPMASAGFEPANLGTKGQHATSRPLKLHSDVRRIVIPGNLLVPEMPDVTTFTVFAVLRTSLVMGISFIQCTGYKTECMVRALFSI